MKIWYLVHDNEVSCLDPEVWAQESLIALEANCVAANVVYRDFSNEIMSEGHICNTRIPATFFAQRKTDADEVTIQDVEYVNVPIPLNQHLHTSS